MNSQSGVVWCAIWEMYALHFCPVGQTMAEIERNFEDEDISIGDRYADRYGTQFVSVYHRCRTVLETLETAL